MLAFPSAYPFNTCGTRHKATGLASASKRKSRFFFRRQDSTDFLQNPQNPPRALPVHDVIYIPKSQFSIWDFYFDICERHILPARVLTPALKFAPN